MDASVRNTDSSPALVEIASIAVALAAIAYLAPEPAYGTDRPIYEKIAANVIIPNCGGLHCFRLLVPGVIGLASGTSIVVWKAYAVLFNAAAAFAVALLGLQLGYSMRASRIAMWLSAFGFGSLFTLFDPHTSDPLMFFLGPMLTLLLLRGQLGLAGMAGSIGIFAKEFAAMPLWIVAAASWLRGRRREALSVGAVAAGVTVLWVALQAVLMTAFGYSYAGSQSTQLLSGGYLLFWVQQLGVPLAVSSVFSEFGALYLLAPFGLWQAGVELRSLMLAALLPLLALGYVQQPDRAFWNFHYLVTPAAGLVLERVPSAAIAAFVASFIMANLRFGAQLPFLPAGRYALLASMLIGCAALLVAWRKASAQAIPEAA